MFCTKCGARLGEYDRFCSQCGIRTVPVAAPALRVDALLVDAPHCLMLDKRNRRFAGVCAGLARYLDLDVTLVRVVWLAVAITTGIGFLAYIAAWMIMPSDYGRPMPVNFSRVAPVG